MTWIVAALKSVASPTEFTYLGSPKPVAVGDKDHGRIPMAVAITFDGLHQLLGLGQVLALPVVGVRTATGNNCSLFAGWALPRRGLISPAFAGSGKFVLNGTDRPFGDHSGAKERVAPAIRPWTLHDLRRSFASGMQRLGVAYCRISIEPLVRNVLGRSWDISTSPLCQRTLEQSPRVTDEGSDRSSVITAYEAFA